MSMHIQPYCQLIALVNRITETILNITLLVLTKTKFLPCTKTKTKFKLVLKLEQKLK